MSWELDLVEETKCPCGDGAIVKKHYSDDWNRYEENVFLRCEHCERLYHIESLLHYHGFDCTYDYYLVKNGETLRKPYMHIDSFEKEIALDFYQKDLNLVLEILCKEKYATRVTDLNARYVIQLHKKYCGTVRLSIIIPKVENVLENYDEFEWNKEKYDNEKKRIEAVEKIWINFCSK